MSDLPLCVAEVVGVLGTSCSWHLKQRQSLVTVSGLRDTVGHPAAVSFG